MFRNPFQQLDEERKDSEMRLQKMKAEMEAVFEQKVKEKIARLKESEASVRMNCCMLFLWVFL